MIRCILLVATLMLAAPALAQSPAAIPDPGQSRAEAAFDNFAKDWMAKVQRMEAQNRKQPSVKPGSQGELVTYRGYGDDYSIELRPTGHAAAPYVGLLRYTEHVYSCRSMKANDCAVVTSVPVTEIFRFQNGRWTY
jgi:hypothetical protein